MSIQVSLENFEEIYNSTYERTLRYIVCKCSNIDDVNDLIQDTYMELYKILKRKKVIEPDNCQNFIIGIADNKIKRHYGILYRLKVYSTVSSFDEDYEIDIPDDIDLEAKAIVKLNAQMVWRYIKSKDIKVVRVFYLYYYSDLKILQIAKELDMTESNVKNVLYRTIKDIKENVKIEGDLNV